MVFFFQETFQALVSNSRLFWYHLYFLCYVCLCEEIMNSLVLITVLRVTCTSFSVCHTGMLPRGVIVSLVLNPWRFKNREVIPGTHWMEDRWTPQPVWTMWSRKNHPTCTTFSDPAMWLWLVTFAELFHVLRTKSLRGRLPYCSDVRL